MSVEAQVLFGNEVREAMQALKVCVTRYQMAVEAREDSPQKPSQTPDLLANSRGGDLTQAVTAAADKLRKHLTPYVRAGLPKVKRRKPDKVS